MSTPIIAAAVPPAEGHEIDHHRATRAVRELLVALGENPDREGLRDTPRRVASMFAELFAGRAQDPSEILSRTFAEDFGELVLLRGIELTSVCEHHLLPVVGQAHVAYVAGDRVVGLSKLARLVDAFARRPTVQERLTREIADALMQHLNPAGALVAVEAEHYCMRMRGVRKAGATTWTVAARGTMRDDRGLRTDTLSLMRRA